MLGAGEGRQPRADRGQRGSAGRLRFQSSQQRAQARLQTALGLQHPALHRLCDLLPQGHGLVQGEAAHHPARDALGVVARADRGLAWGPRGGGRGRASSQAHDGGQHLPRDAGGARTDALQDHLGQDDGREVLARGLVHDLDVVAGRHQAAQTVQGHVAPGVGVVELAVAVPPHDPRPGPACLTHGPNLTHRVKIVKMY